MSELYRVYVTLAYPHITGMGKHVKRPCFQMNRDTYATSQENAIVSPVFKTDGIFGWIAKPWHAVWRTKGAMEIHLVCPRPGEDHCKECGCPTGESVKHCERCYPIDDTMPPSALRKQPRMTGELKTVKLAKGQTQRNPKRKKTEVVYDQEEIAEQAVSLFDDWE